MYEPQVDDYVIWNRPNGDIEEGWVYFKGDPVDNEKRVKQGWNTISRYITIETGVKDKPKEQIDCKSATLHNKVHTLLLCYESQWKDLKFIKRRESTITQHYSQYDDRNSE